MSDTNVVNGTSTVAPQKQELNVNALGDFLDGWSDLIEGMGGKADEVRQLVLKQLQDRNMPDINLGSKTGVVSLGSGEKRDYVVADTQPGAYTTIYISKHGNDLYASWRTWIEPKFNWNLLKWFGLAAVVLGLISGGTSNNYGIFGSSRISFSLTGWIFSTIGFACLEFILLGIAGRIIKGRFFAYFFIEPNVFDAEDITAMSLSVHKSILHSLDNAGIDISKLRVKQTFKGGRRDDEV